MFIVCVTMWCRYLEKNNFDDASFLQLSLDGTVYTKSCCCTVGIYFRRVLELNFVFNGVCDHRLNVNPVDVCLFNRRYLLFFNST